MSKDTIYRLDAINTALEFFAEFLDGAFNENAQNELIARFQRLSSTQPNRKSCKGCIHLPHGYKLPCTSCARNTSLPDRFEMNEE